MNPSETATNLMNGCQGEVRNYLKYKWYSKKYTDNICGRKKYLCERCLSIIKAKRECWQEELEFLGEKVNFIDSMCIFEDVNKRIEEIQQALKITESVQ